ncbi:MAG: hypothetical protein Q8M20_03825 [Rhodocyclaceae bacterium]|nr:hypothetical protein [Rhodocyclaceae bacterium]MDZ4216648.1 hypothetical protein [Rhodocyclaceae bacterium]
MAWSAMRSGKAALRLTTVPRDKHRREVRMDVDAEVAADQIEDVATGVVGTVGPKALGTPPLQGGLTELPTICQLTL